MAVGQASSLVNRAPYVRSHRPKSPEQVRGPRYKYQPEHRDQRTDLHLLWKRYPPPAFIATSLPPFVPQPSRESLCPSPPSPFSPAREREEKRTRKKGARGHGRVRTGTSSSPGAASSVARRLDGHSSPRAASFGAIQPTTGPLIVQRRSREPECWVVAGQ